MFARNCVKALFTTNLTKSMASKTLTGANAYKKSIFQSSLFSTKHSVRTDQDAQTQMPAENAFHVKNIAYYLKLRLIKDSIFAARKEAPLPWVYLSSRTYLFLCANQNNFSEDTPATPSEYLSRAELEKYPLPEDFITAFGEQAIQDRFGDPQTVSHEIGNSRAPSHTGC